jgi:hypothetical protein
MRTVAIVIICVAAAGLVSTLCSADARKPLARLKRGVMRKTEVAFIAAVAGISLWKLCGAAEPGAIPECEGGLLPIYREPILASLPHVPPGGTLVLGFIVEESGEVMGPYIVRSTSTWKRGDHLQLENIKKWRFPQRDHRCRHQVTFKWEWDK